MHARKVLLLLVYFLTLLLSVAVAKRYSSDKRVQGPSGFKTMMRYGRSGISKEGGKVSIHPRADAFFLGPRYGKRSSSWSPNSPSIGTGAATSLVYPVSAAAASSPADLCAMVDGDDVASSCAYTGISDLYRCTPRKERGAELLSTPN